MSAEMPLFLPVTVTLANVTFLQVHRYTLSEALNAIPEMTVDVFGTDPDVDMAALLGQPITVELAEPAVPRFDGIVRHVEQRPLGLVGASVFTLTVVPRPWLLHKRSGHRIFQDRNALEIAADVLSAHGDAMDQPEALILQHVLPTYEYRVQCGETDHDFLFRILSEHGLVALWAPGADGRRRWIVTDDTTAGSADMSVPYRPATGALEAIEPHVSAAAVLASLCSSEARLRDYDYRKPAFVLEQRHLSGDAPEIEEPLSRYSFAVGRFEDEKGGELLAQRRVEEERTQSRTFRWETSFAARPGMRIRLQDHPRDDANGDFLVVSARSEVRKGARKHVVEVVPASAPWRPPVLPKPRIQGSQTAFVAGAPGKEIDVDSEGRIAVRFHWDTRKDGMSRRVRVAMPWAGLGRAFWTVPRVGDEVVIGYLDGDPDQPLVLGSVNNATAPTALPLPDFETRSAWVSRTTPGGDGYNYIVMDDAKGKELLALRAERDFVCDTTRNSQTNIGGAAALSVVQGQSVEVGGDASVTVKGQVTVTAGEVTIESKGGRTDVSGLYHSIDAGSLLVTTKYAVKMETDEMKVTAKTVKIEADEIRLSAGGASIVIGDGKITLCAPLVEINP